MSRFRFLPIAIVFASACGMPASPSSSSGSGSEAPVDDPSDIAAGWDTCSADLPNAGQVVAARESAINDCYAARSDHALQGQLILALHIAVDGHVDDTRVGGALSSSDIATCARGAFHDVRFMPQGGTCGVLVIPYAFHPSDTGASTTSR